MKSTSVQGVQGASFANQFPRDIFSDQRTLHTLHSDPRNDNDNEGEVPA